MKQKQLSFHTKRGILFLLSVFVIQCLYAQQADLVLPINHGTQVESISFSADGQYLISCSNGQVKLWETATGQLLRTIDKQTNKELETNNDWEGGFKMAALSADGKLILTGRDCGLVEGEPGSGNSPTNIQLWEGSSGKKISTLPTEKTPACIQEIAFSPDDRYALAIYRVSLPPARIVNSFRNTPPPGFDSPTNQDSTEIIISESTQTRSVITTTVWDLQTQSLLLNRLGETGRFSADGKYLMSQDSNTVYWTDLSTQEMVSSFQSDTNIEYVAVSEDWSYLYTSSVTTYSDGEAQPMQITTWDLQQKQKISSFTVDRPIDNMIPSKDGKSLILSGFQLYDVQIWDPWRRQKIATFPTYNRPHFQQNDAILSIVMTEDETKDMAIKQLRYDLAAQKYLDSLRIPIKPSPGGVWGTLSPDGSLFAFTNQTMEGDFRAELKAIDFRQPQKVIAFGATAFGINYTLSRILLSLPEGYSTAQVLGDKGEWLYFDEELLFDVQRKEWVDPQLRTSQNLQENKEWHLSSIDGISVILSRLENGQAKEKATLLFLNEEGPAEWVVSTPVGFFDGSPNGRTAMHYVDGLESIGLEQFEERYYEPGVLDKILSQKEEELRKIDGLSLINMYPKVNGVVKNHQLEVDLERRNGGIGKLSFYINGIEVEEDINRDRKVKFPINLKQYSKYFFTDAPNSLGLVAYNEEGWFKSRAYEWSYNPSAIQVNSRGTINTNRTRPPSRFEHRRAKLYALVVGTSKYRGGTLNLEYADKDALAFAKALDIATKDLFIKGRQIEVLTTQAESAAQKPTKDNIQHVLAEFAKVATPYDVVVLYFAGHGISLGQDENVQFYYLTQDVLANPTVKDKKVLAQSTISSSELARWQSAIASPKKVMILDACQSGQLGQDLFKERSITNARRGRALDRMKNRTGMFILSGSAADQASLEASPYGHGLLTYSLLQGMKVISRQHADKHLNVQALFQHCKNEVQDLAESLGREQVPAVIGGGRDAADYPIGILENPDLIQTPTVKPMVAKPRFMDKQQYSDVWKIGEKLQNQFYQISQRGSDPPYIFINNDPFGDAYSLQGFSAKAGTDILIEGALLKGNKVIQRFSKKGPPAEIDALVLEIYEDIEFSIE